MRIERCVPPPPRFAYGRDDTVRRPARDRPDVPQLDPVALRQLEPPLEERLAEVADRILLGRRLHRLPFGPERPEIPGIQLAVRVTQMGLVEPEFALVHSQRTAEPRHRQIPRRHTTVGRPRPMDVLRPGAVRQELQQSGRRTPGNALGVGDLGFSTTEQQRRSRRASEMAAQPR